MTRVGLNLLQVFWLIEYAIKLSSTYPSVNYSITITNKIFLEKNALFRENMWLKNPRDLLKCLVPTWSFQFNQESVSRLIIQPLLGLLSNSPKYIKEASHLLPQVTPTFLPRNGWQVLPGDSENPLGVQSYINTFIKTKLPKEMLHRIVLLTYLLHSCQ